MISEVGHLEGDLTSSSQLSSSEALYSQPVDDKPSRRVNYDAYLAPEEALSHQIMLLEKWLLNHIKYLMRRVQIFRRLEAPSPMALPLRDAPLYPSRLGLRQRSRKLNR